MFSFAQAPRDSDAPAVNTQLSDAQRFVSDVEELAARAGPGDPPSGPERIGGLDHTGTAYAVVDQVGRFVDIGLTAGWWAALGHDRVAAGLLEALRSARMKAALVPLILRRNGVPLETLPSSTDFLHTAGGRIADAYRLIDEHLDDRQSVQLIAGPRGLFRLHVRGGRITSAEAGPRRPTAADTDRLAADARDAFAELARVRDVTLEARLR